MTSATDLEDEDGRSLLFWISPWGLASVTFAALALVQAVAGGFRFLTVLLACVGGIVVYLGVRATQDNRRTVDRIWFILSGILNGAVVALALFAPGILNGWWELDRPVPGSDGVTKQVAVPRDKILDEGRALADDDWADAATEAIRQDGLVIRVESIKIGSVAGKGSDKYLLIHLRLANVGSGQTIKFEGFNVGEHKPVLTDNAGGAYGFQEQRLRKPARGAPVFETSGAMEGVELSVSHPQDLLLIFASPPPKFESLRLEIPAAAWGRKGTCKMRIPGVFEVGSTDKKK